MRTKSALVLALLATLPAPAVASAETLTVTGTADGNATCTTILCSLRAALARATTNGSTEDDTIIVRGGVYTLDAQLGTLNVPANNTRITIRGDGANATIIQPGTAFRTMTINSGAGVTISDLTLQNGQVLSGSGGNLLTDQATVTLSRVRITGGRAQRGGGIAATALGQNGALTISASLIDGNTATAATTTDFGGGIYAGNGTQSTTLVIEDSTITGNQAQLGGGIGVAFGPAPILRGVTLARNTARGNPAVGGLYLQSASARVQGSIIADNISAAGASNCSAGVINDGGNVESAADCGFTNGRQNTDALLSDALDTTAVPPVLSIPAGSPAVDFADCGARTVDQRGVARPQGPRCDAGAFEYKAPDPEPTVTPTATAPPTTTPVPTITPVPTAVPTPVFHSSVVSREVSGRILVRRPGASKFAEIDASVPIPLGSTVDARKGKVEITSVPAKNGKPESARFYDGLFKITQPGSVTQLALTEALAPCKRSARASAAAKKPKTRKLWGDGKGRFRTKGSYSAATVRGTKWLVQDSCAGTLTRVTQGTVNVRDTVRRKTILVRPGKPYTARPKR